MQRKENNNTINEIEVVPWAGMQHYLSIPRRAIRILFPQGNRVKINIVIYFLQVMVVPHVYPKDTVVPDEYDLKKEE